MKKLLLIFSIAVISALLIEKTYSLVYEYTKPAKTIISRSGQPWLTSKSQITTTVYKPAVKSPEFSISPSLEQLKNINPDTDCAGRDFSGVSRFPGSVRRIYSKFQPNGEIVIYTVSQKPDSVFSYFTESMKKNGWGCARMADGMIYCTKENDLCVIGIDSISENETNIVILKL